MLATSCRCAPFAASGTSRNLLPRARVPLVTTSPIRPSLRQLPVVQRRASDAPGEQVAAPAIQPYELPETIKEAIVLGDYFAQQQDWTTALDIFEKALTLPGNGVKRFRDKPKGITDGEKAAALYNIACCHSQLNNPRPGLIAIGSCLEAGYNNFAQLRSDPDLAELRKDPRFEGLMGRFEPKTGPGIFGGLQRFLGGN